MRRILIAALCLNSAVAAAAVTCDQLGNIALTTERLRNQGYSLPALLDEADKVAAAESMTPQETASVREVVVLTFNSDRSPLEIRQKCKEPVKK